MRSSLTTLLALLAVLPSAAQPQLISDHPAIKAAVKQFLGEQAVQTAVSAKSAGARFAAAGPVYGGGYQLQTPPVALRLNRLQYNDRDTFQASLVVLPGAPTVSDTSVGLSVLWVHLDSNYTRGTYAGRHVLLTGETIPLQTYVFDGSEPSGLYAYVVMVTDVSGSQVLAMPVTWFSFRCFFRSDVQGYLRVDSTEYQGRYVLLRGNFRVEASPSQFALIGGQTFPIVRSSQTEALVDLGDQWALPAGVYDITLIVHTPGNTSYDSTTTPCVLRIFLPSGKG